MDNLLLSLALGVGLAFVGFSLIYKFSHLQGKQVALIVAMAMFGLYGPWAIISWPGADIFAIHFALYMVTPYALGIITSHWEARAAAGDVSRGRWLHWGPTTIVVFFLTIASVDAVIITLAGSGLSSGMAKRILPEPMKGGGVSSFFPGTVAHDYQKKEAYYNAYLVQLQRQTERGWQVKKGFVGTPQIDHQQVFRVQVLDKAGAPVSQAAVSVEFLRPSDSRQDMSLALDEVKAGVYEASVRFSGPGSWDVLIRITRGEDVHELRGMTSIAQ